MSFLSIAEVFHNIFSCSLMLLTICLFLLCFWVDIWSEICFSVVIDTLFCWIWFDWWFGLTFVLTRFVNWASRLCWLVIWIHRGFSCPLFEFTLDLVQFSDLAYTMVLESEPDSFWAWFNWQLGFMLFLEPRFGFKFTIVSVCVFLDSLLKPSFKLNSWQKLT